MSMINIVVPIAGRAQRFLDKGYNVPKPLIMAGNTTVKPIIEWAISSLAFCNDYRFIFIVRQDHVDQFGIDEYLYDKFKGCLVLTVNQVTRGSVETCLIAKQEINNNDELIIYTPDVYYQPAIMINHVKTDGMLLTFKANSPAHSYVSSNGNPDHLGYSLVDSVVEKRVISNDACVGVYYFNKGKTFIKYAERMIKKNITTNNEFYIAPIFDMMIKDGLKVLHKNVTYMQVLGTPEELEFFNNFAQKNHSIKPVGLCADHSGYNLKEEVKSVLMNSFGMSFIDYGCHTSLTSCDYYDFMKPALDDISNKKIDFVFAFCRTGQGMNIAANKHKDVLSALVFDEYTMEYARRHNCANVYSFPTKYVDLELFTKMMWAWDKETTMFEGGRHMTRIQKFNE